MVEQAEPLAFALGEDQREFRSAVRTFLERFSSEDQLRLVIESHDGYDPAIWRAMAEQLDLQGLIVPEEFGGQGFGFTELALVLEEMGSALLPGPFFASAVLATSVLLHSGDDAAKRRFLPEIASGQTIATVAFTERSGRWDLDRVETQARRISGGWVLDGTKHYVLDGVLADVILVVARDSDGIGVFSLDDVSSLVRRPQSSLDSTRRQAVLELNGSPATRIDTDARALRTALAHCSAALACEQVGGAQRCLDQAVAYVKVRRQFGRPVGSFQAIRHTCADLMLAIECARGAAQYAAHAADALPAALPAAAALAKAHSTEVFTRAAAANIQLHGGIGFTWEHPAHLYFKRASSSAMLLGDADHHRRILADVVGL